MSGPYTQGPVRIEVTAADGTVMIATGHVTEMEVDDRVDTEDINIWQTYVPVRIITSRKTTITMDVADFSVVGEFEPEGGLPS